MKRSNSLFFFFIFLFLATRPAYAYTQVLTLQQALNTSVSNYELLKAKKNYANASGAAVVTAKRDGLPDVTVAAQQEYGTLNGMNGLTSGMPGLSTITNGPALATQNWNAAFGALYVSNINWNIFSFGMQRAHVAAAKGLYEQDKADIEQEKFLLQVKVSVAYLDLLAAQRLRLSMEVNLSRAIDLSTTIHARTDNGLNAGVDSSIANAEISRARLSLTDALNYEQVKSSQLATLLGKPMQVFSLDTSFVSRLPRNLLDSSTIDQHPVLAYMGKRIAASNLQANYIRKAGLPRFSLFGVLQDRGSGFGYNYGLTDPNDYTTRYFQGVNPVRVNYLLGVGVAWNIMEWNRSASRVKTQSYVSAAFTNEYNQEKTDLSNQSALADRQISNALSRYREAPIQLRAATDAYIQKTELYQNGLANISDVAQALFALNRAETDRDIAYNSVWQAVLFKVAATGDLPNFLSQL
jgi:outer membrane protein TolC